MSPFESLRRRVERFLELEELSPEAISEALDCELQGSPGGRRFRGQVDGPPGFFLDLRLAERATVLVLDLMSCEEQVAMAAEVHAMGPPEAMDVVSPSVFDPNMPHSHPPWDYKYSLGYRLAGKMVHFGVEKTDEVERLVSIAVDLPVES